MTRTQQAFIILVLGGVFLGGWLGLCRVFGWHARLAENNYQANIIRLETFLDQRTPPAVLVGSSMTGRLLPEYFVGTPLQGVANLGLDGSTPDLGLEVVLRRKVPPALVLVEVNTLFNQTPRNDATLRQAMDSFSFRLADRLPFLRAEYRPSSIAYSTLKLWQDRRLPPPPVASAAEHAASLEPSVAVERELPVANRQHADQLLARLREFKARGAQVILYQLPGGNQALPPIVEEWCREFQSPLIRLGPEMVQRGRTPAFTDGLHLTAPSAEQASDVLAQIVWPKKP